MKKFLFGLFLLTSIKSFSQQNLVQTVGYVCVSTPTHDTLFVVKGEITDQIVQVWINTNSNSKPVIKYVNSYELVRLHDKYKNYNDVNTNPIYTASK